MIRCVTLQPIVMSQKGRKQFALDWVTIALYAVMVLFGWLNIYGATYSIDQEFILSFEKESGRQLVWIGGSVLLGCIVLLIDSKFYDLFSYVIYGGIILLLIATIFIADDIKGSHSWISLGPLSLQPAEFAKTATILALAKYMGRYGYKPNSLSDFIVPICLILLPVGCIILQKETGSALVFFSLFLMLYREGLNPIILLLAVAAVVFFILTIRFGETPLLIGSGSLGIILCCALLLLIALYYLYIKEHKKKESAYVAGVAALTYTVSLLLCKWITVNLQWVSIGLVVACSLYLGYLSLSERKLRWVYLLSFQLLSLGFCFSCNYIFQDVLQKHQTTRIKVFLGMENNLSGEGYNVNQSKIAIGSGGFWGKGFLNGTQTKLKYVPEQHTDFIFCTVGEEWGFVGSFSVLIIYWFFLMRMIKLAERQRNSFNRIFGYGVVSIFFFHLVINIGMVIGLMPVIGIPLPFFSYGGSSLLGFTLLLFIFLRLDAERLEKIKQI